MDGKKIILRKILILFVLAGATAPAALLSSDTTGTILTCTTTAPAKDFVLLYDAVEGTGRPVSATFIESDGTTNMVSNSYSAAYANTVDGVAGAFGAVVPNILPSGIRRIERRSLTTGKVVGAATDADGVWPSGKSTVNPSTGTTPIVLAGSDVTFTTLSLNDLTETPKNFDLLQNYPNPFNPTTTIRFEIREAGFVSLKVYDLLGEEIATLRSEQQSPGVYSVVYDASELSNGMYWYQLKTGNNAEIKKMMVLK